MQKINFKIADTNVVTKHFCMQECPRHKRVKINLQQLSRTTVVNNKQTLKKLKKKNSKSHQLRVIIVSQKCVVLANNKTILNLKEFASLLVEEAIIC